MADRQLVSFDWALKRLLRSKANFEILEGFLIELLKAGKNSVDSAISEEAGQSDNPSFYEGFFMRINILTDRNVDTTPSPLLPNEYGL